ncbi:hypothetical protein BDY21DRAFT_360010 [Lineolata rhizophorae]|uniref:Uncharacterized protein n=1 Tax=Lineolata rhizophorae TaxID=578093 RepID=A0A6A6PE10_9PEZI|nr:hypothetical protein BDY21DRAFT_360010 [Lineolata rhizophorae]
MSKAETGPWAESRPAVLVASYVLCACKDTEGRHVFTVVQGSTAPGGSGLSSPCDKLQSAQGRDGGMPQPKAADSRSACRRRGRSRIARRHQKGAENQGAEPPASLVEGGSARESRSGHLLLSSLLLLLLILARARRSACMGAHNMANKCRASGIVACPAEALRQSSNRPSRRSRPWGSQQITRGRRCAEKARSGYPFPAPGRACSSGRLGAPAPRRRLRVPGPSSRTRGGRRPGRRPPGTREPGASHTAGRRRRAAAAAGWSACRRPGGEVVRERARRLVAACAVCAGGCCGAGGAESEQLPASSRAPAPLAEAPGGPPARVRPQPAPTTNSPRAGSKA